MYIYRKKIKKIKKETSRWGGRKNAVTSIVKTESKAQEYVAQLGDGDSLGMV